MWNDNLSPKIEKLAKSVFKIYNSYIVEINTDKKYRNESIGSFWGNDIIWSDESIINYIIICSEKDGWLENYIDKLSEEDKTILFSYVFSEK